MSTCSPVVWSAGWRSCWRWSSRCRRSRSPSRAGERKRRSLPRRLAVGLAVVVLAAAPAAAADAAPVLTATAAHRELPYGQKTAIVGSLRDADKPQPGQPVELQSDPYPFGAFEHEAFGMTGENGSYSFTVAPDRNTRYRVAATGAPADLRVLVDEVVRVRATPLPLGRVRVSVRSRHPGDLRWGARRAYWFVAQGRDRLRRVGRIR